MASSKKLNLIPGSALRVVRECDEDVDVKIQQRGELQGGVKSRSVD